MDGRTPASRQRSPKVSAVYWLSSTGRRNTPPKGVAMTTRRRRSERSGRAKLRSPGRPSVRRPEEQRRFWAAIAIGHSSEDAAISAGVSPAVGARWFREAGGMAASHLMPSAPPLSGRYLAFTDREQVALWRAQGLGVREIARRVARAASTIPPPLRRPRVPGDDGPVACRSRRAPAETGQARNQYRAAAVRAGAVDRRDHDARRRQRPKPSGEGEGTPARTAAAAAVGPRREAGGGCSAPPGRPPG